METLKNSKRTKNPYEGMNWLLKILLWHVNKIYRTAEKRSLESADIFEITKDQETKYLVDKLEREWQKELLHKKKINQKPSFFWSILRMAGLRILFIGILLLLSESIRIAQSICLKNLLETLSAEDVESNDAYYWATAISLCLLIFWALIHPTYYFAEKLGLSLKSATVALIYKKALRLNSASMASITTGHVVTLISSDAHKLQEGLLFANYIWIGPMQLIAVIFILWRELGPPSMAGVAVLLLIFPIQGSFAKCYASMRLKTVLNTDKRVNIMNEVISSMHVTKMYTWEDSFASVINGLRKAESNKIMKSAMFRAVSTSIFSISPYLVFLGTFTVLYYHGDDFSLALVFLTMSLFFSIQLGVTYFFPLGIQMMMEFYVACKRIEKFLLQEEIKDNVKVKESSEPCVVFDEVAAVWTKASDAFTYKNLSFKADKENSLVMIFGPVGAGKSSILMTVMKELEIVEGKLHVNGSIAYSAQQPWIFSGTIRLNILFGKKYDRKRYKKIIEACALKQDIEAFEKGDLTLVGEKGVTLSGGQKARISLARAVYHDADIYLLDDPLSAVDPKVGKHIFENCILGLLKEKIVILVTHQTQYAHNATDIIRLKEKSMKIEKSPDNVFEQGHEAASIIPLETSYKETPENRSNTEHESSDIRSRDNPSYEHDAEKFSLPMKDGENRSPSAVSLALDESRRISRGSFSQSRRISRGSFSESFRVSRGSFSQSCRGNISTMKNDCDVFNEEGEEKYMKGNVPFKLYKEYLLGNGGGCVVY